MGFRINFIYKINEVDIKINYNFINNWYIINPNGCLEWFKKIL